MTETQEPITTIEPILGLGEDYQPFDLSDDDEVWIPTNPKWAAALLVKHYPQHQGPGACWVSEDAVMKGVGCGAVMFTLKEVIDIARKTPDINELVLIDAEWKTLKTWHL